MSGNKREGEEPNRDHATVEIREVATRFGENLLPDKSERQYKQCYDQFVEWQKERKTTCVSEDTMLVYFDQLSNKFKPSSLWSKYSMLKSTILTFRKVNIGKYYRLTAFLSENCKGYTSTKSKTLESNEVERFLSEAPDDRYLAIKVALILGVTGACRREELKNVTVQDIEHHDNMMVVKIPRPRNAVPRKFIIDGEFYKIVKKYADLRPKNVQTDRFFLTLRNGKCTQQVIGINTFGAMPKLIAEYLGLDQPERYTGHSFRRTSATMLADAGLDILNRKRPRELKSDKACLRWNSYHSNIQNSFVSLLDSEQFVDVTLACEGRSLKCHKVILSSCSGYLATLLRDNPCQHPIILMKDHKFWEVEALVKFMYQGEINIAHDKLPQLLNAATALQIKGLPGASALLQLQNPRPPKLVPRSKTLISGSVTPSARVATEANESGKPSASSGAAALTRPKQLQKRQSSEPMEPRLFTKIRLQRLVTPTSPNPTVKLEPLDLPPSPTGIFPDHHNEDSSTASNLDNLGMTLHEDEDRGSGGGDMHFCDVPGPPDDLNDADPHVEFVSTGFLKQEQDVVEEAEGDCGKCSNEDEIYEEEIDEDEMDEDELDEDEEYEEEMGEDEGDEDEVEDREKPPDNRKLIGNTDDRGGNRKTEKRTNADKIL